MDKKEYYVYMVICSDNTIYTGYTNNVKKRIDKHNKGIGAKYTRNRRPVQLVYSETHQSKSDAMKRENQIKKLNHLEKISLISFSERGTIK